MAIGGHALAKIDVSGADNGDQLITSGSTLTRSLSTVPGAASLVGDQGISMDIGILISEPAADGLGQVWLR